MFVPWVDTCVYEIRPIRNAQCAVQPNFWYVVAFWMGKVKLRNVINTNVTVETHEERIHRCRAVQL